MSNTGTYGGAIAVDSRGPGTVYVETSHFEDNVAWVGAGMYVDGGGTLELGSGITYLNNKCNMPGACGADVYFDTKAKEAK